MSEEVKNYIENTDFNKYKLVVDREYKEEYIQGLEQENNQLKEKINTYENPEDLTLMFMYCDEKAKDKIKQLKEVIEEVREYVDNNTEFEHDGDDYGYTEWVNIKPQNIVFINELLQILDKVKDVK